MGAILALPAPAPRLCTIGILERCTVNVVPTCCPLSSLTTFPALQES